MDSHRPRTAPPQRRCIAKGLSRVQKRIRVTTALCVLCLHSGTSRLVCCVDAFRSPLGIGNFPPWSYLSNLTCTCQKSRALPFSCEPLFHTVAQAKYFLFLVSPLQWVGSPSPLVSTSLLSARRTLSRSTLQHNDLSLPAAWLLFAPPINRITLCMTSSLASRTCGISSCRFRRHISERRWECS